MYIACPWYGFHLLVPPPNAIFLDTHGNECPHDPGDRITPCSMETDNLPVDWHQCPARERLAREGALDRFVEDGQIVLFGWLSEITVDDWYRAFNLVRGDG